jgi:hypothetical protein
MLLLQHDWSLARTQKDAYVKTMLTGLVDKLLPSDAWWTFTRMLLPAIPAVAILLFFLLGNY